MQKNPKNWTKMPPTVLSQFSCYIDIWYTKIYVETCWVQLKRVFVDLVALIFVLGVGMWKICRKTANFSTNIILRLLNFSRTKSDKKTLFNCTLNIVNLHIASLEMWIASSFNTPLRAKFADLCLLSSHYGSKMAARRR